MNGQASLLPPDDGLRPWQRSRLYDGHPPSEPKDQAGTSRAAALSVEPKVGTVRAQVLAAIRWSPDGLTDDQIEERLELRHQTASARRRELVLLGQVVDSGRRRITRSGRAAVVWVEP